MIDLIDIPEAVQRDGFEVIEDILDESAIVELIHAVEVAQATNDKVRRREAFSMRNLLDIPAINTLADSQPVRTLIEPLLGGNYFPVRGILFDKTPGANWKVAWHQDLTIAVRERVETEGFGAWSTKAGVVHVQPPVEILESMLTLRLHLDDCDETNGALKVLPKSHLQGRLNPNSIQQWRAMTPSVTCSVRRGGVLLMKPLVLHASSACQTPCHRRVVHLEFAAQQLPGTLQWCIPT